MSIPDGITEIFTKPTAQVAEQCRALVRSLSASRKSGSVPGDLPSIEHVFVPEKFDAVFRSKPDGRNTSGWGRSLLRVTLEPDEKRTLKTALAEYGLSNAVLETHSAPHTLTNQRFNRHVDNGFDRGLAHHVGLIAGDERAVYLDLDYLRDRSRALTETVRRVVGERARDR